MGACLSKAATPPEASGAAAAAAAPPPPADSEPPPAAAPSCAAAPSSDAPVIQAPREEERLNAVHALQLIGVEAKPAFDHITQLMAAMFQTPVSAVSLVAEDLHFISRAGDWACSATRPGSFCDWILAPEAPEMLIVENALEDARFRNNPYVADDPGIRFYAGAPLVATKDGHRYGTLCVFDFQPRSFSLAQYAMLNHFAELTVREMERELALEQQRQMRAPPAGVHLTRAMDAYHEGVILLDLSSTMWHMVYANHAFREAAHMPALLNSTSAAAVNAPPLSPPSSSSSGVDFWQLFRLATADDKDCNNAALLAMASGKEFSIRVQPVASSYSREVGGYSGGGSSQGSGSGKNGSKSGGENGGQAPPVLTMLFRPAGVEPLRKAQPQIGIPAWVGSGSGAGGSGASSREDSGSTPLSPFAALAAAPRRLPQDVKAQPYYFGVVQASSEEPEPQGSLTSSALTLPTPVGTGDRAASARSAGGERPAKDANLAAPFAGFLEVRPEVLQEVKLGALIGRGSMGRAYRGIWQGGRVAVKIIDTWTTPDGKPSALSEWDAPTPEAAVVEALLGRSLTHPHIVTVYAHGVSQEEVNQNRRVYQQVWIVQEYCNRGSLLDAIDRGVLHLQAGAGGPNLAAIIACAQEVAGALCYLHSNDVIHGDLTPSNVLLTSATKDARRFTCKVGDFGLAKYTGGMPEWRSSNFGTVTHMPPELLSSGILSKATDAWSFGVLLLEMWHGTRAWLGVQPIGVMGQVAAGRLPFDVPRNAPPALADVMRRCISLSPAQRPSFQEVLATLAELSSGLQGATPAEAVTGAAASPRSSRRSGVNSSQRAEAARGVAASASPLKPVSPFASPPTSATPSPSAVGAAAVAAPTSATPSPFASQAAAAAAAAAAPASATPSPFASQAAAAAAAAAALTSATPSPFASQAAAAAAAAAAPTSATLLPFASGAAAAAPVTAPAQPELAASPFASRAAVAAAAAAAQPELAATRDATSAAPNAKPALDAVSAPQRLQGASPFATGHRAH